MPKFGARDIGFAVRANQAQNNNRESKMAVDYEAHNEDRMRRARSWLARSQDNGVPDEDGFLFLWIAFNAAYGRSYIERGENFAEYRLYTAFMRRVIALDMANGIKNYLITEITDVQTLIKNKYIFEPFWQYMRGQRGRDDWEARLTRRNLRVLRKWGEGDAMEMLREILFRLYTLRNQLMHGGATYQTGQGRRQLRDGRKIMSHLVPLILQVMQADIDKDPHTRAWGEVAYLSVTEGATPANTPSR